MKLAVMWYSLRSLGQYCHLPLFVAICLLSGKSLAVESQYQITLGHVLGPTESLVVKRVCRIVNDRLPGIDLVFDDSSTDSYRGAKRRFEDRSSLSDIVVVYSGLTNLLDEIPGLVRSGRLQPLNLLPTFQTAIDVGDLYSNLLDPVTIDGYLWAVPVRVSPPCIAISSEVDVDILSWDDLANVASRHGFSHVLPSDAYILWNTLLSQTGNSFFSDGMYRLDEDTGRWAFSIIGQIFSDSQRKYWESAASGITYPDEYFALRALRNDMRFYSIPKISDENNAVYCAESTWYFAVAAHLAGPKRKAAAEVLSEFLSENTQLLIADTTYAPPVRPSIAEGSRFNERFPPGSFVRILSETVPRLRFRGGEHRQMDDERLIIEHFDRAIAAEEAISMMITAVREVNTSAKPLKE